MVVVNVMSKKQIKELVLETIDEEMKAIFRMLEGYRKKLLKIEDEIKAEKVKRRYMR